jgi:hypothetical protein
MNKLVALTHTRVFIPTEIAAEENDRVQPGEQHQGGDLSKCTKNHMALSDNLLAGWNAAMDARLIRNVDIHNFDIQWVPRLTHMLTKPEWSHNAPRANCPHSIVATRC